MKAYCINKSLEHNRILAKFLPDGQYSNFKFKKNMPIYIKRASGSRIIDLDGNEYLDMFGYSGSALLGHNNDCFNKHFRAYYDTTSSLKADIRALEFLNRYIPSAEMIRFSLSGTEAIQNALRLARAYSGRMKILKFEGHYHGNADNILGGSYNSNTFPMPDFNEQDPHYCNGIVPNILQDQMIIIPWNDIGMFTYAMKMYGREIAAVIMEPISVNAGSILPIEGFLQRVREQCDKYGCVLIFDEVITGLRVSIGGAQELLGVTPDISILGKTLGGGLVPVSAIVGKKDIMQLYENNHVIHGGTFNGYNIGQCAICATFETLLELDAYDQMLTISRKIKELFLKYAQEFKFPLIIQGHLSCASFHYAKEEITSFSMINNKILFANSIIRECMLIHGILTASPSRMYSSIAFSEVDVQFVRERIENIMHTAQIVLSRIVNNEQLLQPYLSEEKGEI